MVRSGSILFAMSNLKNYRASYPIAYESVKLHLKQGGLFKTLAIMLLFELGRFKTVLALPILGDLIRTSRGLFFGHVADSLMPESLTVTGDSRISSTSVGGLPEILDVDVLIIGSGPGAAVAADMEISNLNSKICVVERGTSPRTPHELHHSLIHVIRDFFQGGQEIIFSKGFPLFAQGSVIGGGSEVNSGLFHKLPEIYRGGWTEALGISVDEWLQAETYIGGWLRPENMPVLKKSSLLARGSQELNLNCENIPRWRSYNLDGTYIHRGMNHTFWLRSDVKKRISIYGNSEVNKINYRNKQYVEVTVTNCGTKQVSRIRAQRVHVAAGAISTPRLLAKSGLIRWRDTSFSWHPMIRVVAKSESTDLGAGDIDPFQAWTTDRSLKFGSAVSTPSLLSVALGKIVTLEEAASLRSYYVSFSSSGKGGIIPFVGVPWYRFSKKDNELSKLGLSTLISIIQKGGGTILNPERLSSRKYSTVHIFGTIPIISPVYILGTNQLKRDPRVRVSDASILPFGPGVNPQGVVMSSVRVVNRDLVQ